MGIAPPPAPAANTAAAGHDDGMGIAPPTAPTSAKREARRDQESPAKHSRSSTTSQSEPTNASLMAMLQQLVVSTHSNQNETKQYLNYVTTRIEKTDNTIRHLEAAMIKLDDRVMTCEFAPVATTDPAIREQLDQQTRNQLRFDNMLNERLGRLEQKQRRRRQRRRQRSRRRERRRPQLRRSRRTPRTPTTFTRLSS